jgi:hypothetical protein
LTSIPLAGHPAVEDPDPGGLPVQGLHLRHHLVQRRRLRLVSGEDLVPQRQPAPRHHEPDHHLDAIGSVIPAVAPARLGVAFPKALEVRARQVVEQDVEGLLEQRPDPRFEVSLKRRLVGQEMIQGPVEPVFVHPLLRDPADVLERRPRVEPLLDPKLRRGGNQTGRGQDEGHHRPRDLLPSPPHPLLEQFVQPQQVPQVAGEKHLAEVPRPLPPHPVEDDLHHPLARRNRGRVARKQLQLALVRLPVENRDRLAPRRLRRAVQLPEVCQCPVLWTARGPHRFDERVVAVVLAVLAPVVDLEKHADKDCALRSSRYKRVGLYYTPSSKTALNTQAYLHVTRSPKSPLSGGQLRNFG